jgi:hypothetical protein
MMQISFSLDPEGKNIIASGSCTPFREKKCFEKNISIVDTPMFCFYSNVPGCFIIASRTALIKD